jgi:hypothetical protein
MIKVLGWNLDSVESSKALKAPEIILQTAKVRSYERLDNSSKIIHNGVIPAEPSLVKALLDDASCPKNNKVFLGIPEKHNAQLRNVPLLAQLIKTLFTNQQAPAV